MNKEIRVYAKQKNVKLWEIAEKLGMQDTNFSKKLRHELNADEKEHVMKAIDMLAAEKTKKGVYNEQSK